MLFRHQIYHPIPSHPINPPISTTPPQTSQIHNLPDRSQNTTNSKSKPNLPSPKCSSAASSYAQQPLSPISSPSPPSSLALLLPPSSAPLSLQQPTASATHSPSSNSSGLFSSSCSASASSPASFNNTSSPCSPLHFAHLPMACGEFICLSSTWLGRQLIELSSYCQPT